jgi:hypothetical protein
LAGSGAGRFACLFVPLIGLANVVPVPEPEVRAVSVRGFQVGGTTTVVIDGDNLGTAPRLLLPFAAKQTLRPGGTAKQATFDVTLGNDVPAGYANLSVVTAAGVSVPVLIGVDRLPQRPLSASIDQLPVALHGSVNGSTVTETTFTGKAGQRVLVEVEAQQLGGKLRPVAHLYGPRRLQLAWSWPTPILHGDTRLEATLPEDGTYTVAVHDLEYAAAAPSFFRLKVGQWAFVDQMFPPVIGKESRDVELLSPTPVRVDVPKSRPGATQPLAWPTGETWSGPRPFVERSARSEIVADSSPGTVRDLPAGPVGVSARLLTPFGEDRYRIPVTPGTTVRLEVFAERLGSPIDLALAVRKEPAGDLVRVEDSPGTLDPAVDFAVPAGLKSILVAVIDTQGRAGPRGVYRLTINPLPLPADFRLLTPERRVNVPAGGRCVVPVLVERRGYTGGVELSAERLPSGVRLEGTAVPPGAEGALVTVHNDGRGGDAAVSTWRGRGQDGSERSVMVQGHPMERLQPWLAEEIAVAAAGPVPRFEVEWRGLSADSGLVLAGKLALPVKVNRPLPDAPVRLTLLTSQLPPLQNNQPDPNRTLRPEKPVELPAKATDGELTALVPPDLPAPVYDVTVQADLLAADKRTVLATAFTPVRRLAVRLPVAVSLSGPARIEAKRDPKTGVTFEVIGQLERLERMKGDVAVSLTGFPAGVQVAPVTVKAAETKFTLKGTLPANTAAGELSLKLAGTLTPDPNQPARKVRSREVDVTLVVPGAK